MGMFSFVGDIISDITGASGVEDAAQDASAATLEASRRAEALNRERYVQAQGYMMPFAGRSDIASRQLMAELGLPQYMQQSSPRLGEDGAVEGTMQGLESGGGGIIGMMLRKAALGGVEGAQEPANEIPFNPYMGNEQEYTPRDISQIPGYQAVMDESLRSAEQSAVSSGSTAYGGRRLKAAGEVGAGVQQSYYNNYMNMLQNMASPSTATNLASMGMNQGIQMGQQNIASTNQANQYMMGGASARQAGFGDLLGGAAGIFSGALAGGYI